MFVNILFLLVFCFFFLFFLGENEGRGSNRQQVQFLGWEAMAVRGRWGRLRHRPDFASLDLLVFISINVCMLPVII